MASRYKDTGLQSTTMTYVISQDGVTAGTGTAPEHSSRSFMSGVDIPNYHARKKRGDLLPHTSFSQFEGWSHFDGGEHLVRNPQLSESLVENWRPLEFRRELQEGTNSLESLIGDPPIELAQAYVQAAAGRIYSKGWDALTFAGELPSLKRMLKGISRKSTDLAQGHTSHRILSNWLEARYGWRTLAYDIRDFNDAITKFDTNRQLHSERAGFTTTSSGGWDQAYSNLPNGTYYLEESWDVSHSVRGSVTGRIKPARVILDPLKTGWELVPYSFVLDWVIQVGTAIDAYQFLSQASEYSASFGTASTLKYRTKAYAEPATGYVYNCHCNVRAEISKEGRTPTSVTSTPQFNPRPLTSDIGLDLLALSRLRARL